MQYDRGQLSESQISFIKETLLIKNLEYIFEIMQCDENAKFAKALTSSKDNNSGYSVIINGTLIGIYTVKGGIQLGVNFDLYYDEDSWEITVGAF